MLVQWLFLFGWLAVIILPAELFRKIALRNKKEGWAFFMLGLLVGFVALQIGNIVLHFLEPMPPFSGYEYLAVVSPLVGYGVVAVAVMIFKRWLQKG